MEVILFEDPQVQRLHPVTISRPAYAITCGSYRLLDWLWLLQRPLRAVVRPHLRELQRQDFPQLLDDDGPTAPPTVLVNARLVPSRGTYHALGRLLEHGRPAAIWSGNRLAAAILPEPLPVERLAAGASGVEPELRGLALRNLPQFDATLHLLEYPHDIIRWNQQILADNLEYRLSSGAYREVRDGVFAADGAELGEYIVSDTRQGPIVLERGARIGPYCYLSGPAHLGAGARVLEHAAIKDAVSLGHTTKIGGEVEASVIEPYTNKQHHGFLGHSYLGSWINLGAGTCNSDLKNTYGTVKMDYRGEKVATGMQFVGCIVGDYAKSAINTGIFTGKIIGTCSMVYGFVTTNVPSFVNYARLFGQVTELRPDVMVATQERMFARRNVQPRPCDTQLIHDMFELTRDERQMACDPLSL